MLASSHCELTIIVDRPARWPNAFLRFHVRGPDHVTVAPHEAERSTWIFAEGARVVDGCEAPRPHVAVPVRFLTAVLALPPMPLLKGD